MKTKFHVGQVVEYRGGFYKIASRYREEGEEYFMLGVVGDEGYDSVQADDIRPLTKKERGK